MSNEEYLFLLVAFFMLYTADVIAIPIKNMPNSAKIPPPMLAARMVQTTPNSAAIILDMPPIMDGPRPGFILFIIDLLRVI